MSSQNIRVDIEVKVRRDNYWKKIDVVKNLSASDACSILVDKYGALQDDLTLLQQFAKNIADADRRVSAAWDEIRRGDSF